MKIILTGSTGNLGSSTLTHLLPLLAQKPHDLILSVYNPAKVPDVGLGKECMNSVEVRLSD